MVSAPPPLPAPATGEDPVLPPTPPRPTAGPKFYVAPGQPIRPAAVLLAVLVAGAALGLLAVGLRHGKAARAGNSASSPADEGKDDSADDPSQVDTIYLGDAADAPVPATRRNGRAGSVHATVLVRLPRFGDQVGLIPDSPAGHLLYGWLAAFNQADGRALQAVLPIGEAGSSVDAELELRRQSGGFTLVSAKEIAPGVLVFRLHDQTPSFTEALGMLQLRPRSNPAAMASFSLRGVGTP